MFLVKAWLVSTLFVKLGENGWGLRAISYSIVCTVVSGCGALRGPQF